MTAPPDAGADRPGPRAAATEIVRRLVDAGHEAYFAGGCVRDRLLGLEPKDYDVATDARPERIAELFPRARKVGEAFGVMLVHRHRHPVEVATFRTDGVYRDGRHPDEVAFSDARHDASRRDFTINGIFEDPLRGEIIDYVGGRADLEARVVRAIGDAHARLREDRLRTLRAVRFAARFQFALEQGTADAIRAAADDLGGVSRERIGHEVRAMLVDPNRAVAAWELQYLGLDGAVLGEPRHVVAPRRMGRLPADASFPVALAAWMLDRHDRPDETTVRAWADALVLSGAETRETGACVLITEALRGRWWHLGVAGQKRMAARNAFSSALLVLRAEDPQAFVDVRRRVEELAKTGLAPAPLVSGEDLIAAGFTPGPAFGRILEQVYDAQLEGAIHSAQAGLALARTLLAVDGGEA